MSAWFCRWSVSLSNCSPADLDSLSLTGCDVITDSTGLPTAGAYYFHPDHLGSVSYLTDATGAVVTRMYYTPYGEKVKSAISGPDIFNKKYTGQTDDGEDSGLLYYNARYYDPMIGRFISPDTLVPDPTKTQSYNLYSYVDNNPINYRDNSGHFKVGKFFKKVAESVTYGIAGAALGTIAGAAYTFAAPLVIIAGAVAGAIGGFQAGYKKGGFWGGLGCGILGAIGGSAIATLGVVIAGLGGTFIGGINGALGGYNGIYNQNLSGTLAFVLDSTLGLPTTALGIGYMGYLTARGNRIDADLSKGNNAFVFNGVGNSIKAPGMSIGNVIGIKDKIDSENVSSDELKMLRHELSHSWQYRMYGPISSVKLVQEQLTGYWGLGLNDPYNEKWNFEHQANDWSANPPWFL